MKVLFFGDVIGQSSCNYLVSQLPRLKRKHSADLTIVNGENSADGNGITPYSSSLLLSGGADVITTGNHCFKRPEMSAAYENAEFIIRPANYGDDVPGKGFCVLDFGGFSVAVVNLSGSAYMYPCENPFRYVDGVLQKIDTKNIIVDFHAEATAEKKAMGYYLSKRVSAVIGTHTHVQTADEQIIDAHTAYITDAGMTGIENSVLGIDKNVIIERLSTYYPKKHTYPSGTPTICGVVLDLDVKTGKCSAIERIYEKND